MTEIVEKGEVIQLLGLYGKTGTTTFDYHWKNGDRVSAVDPSGTETAEGFFYVRGAWHFRNTLPNMIRGQAFRIITLQPPGVPLSAT